MNSLILRNWWVNQAPFAIKSGSHLDQPWKPMSQLVVEVTLPGNNYGCLSSPVSVLWEICIFKKKKFHADGWGFTLSGLLLKYTSVSNQHSSWPVFMSLTALKALGHPLSADTGYLQITIMETRPTFCLLQQLPTTVHTAHLRKSFWLILERPSKLEAHNLLLKHHLFRSPQALCLLKPLSHEYVLLLFIGCTTNCSCASASLGRTCLSEVFLHCTAELMR